MNYVRQLDKGRQEKPLLFSYRRCPYAMRARMALLSCGVDFDIFEISLKDKPKKMIEISSKGTVPVFVYNDLVLDESIDIMNWATKQKNNISIKINPHDLAIIKSMIKINDGEFKDTIRKALADELLFGKLVNGGEVEIDIDAKEEIVLNIKENEKASV